MVGGFGIMAAASKTTAVGDILAATFSGSRVLGGEDRRKAEDPYEDAAGPFVGPANDDAGDEWGHGPLLDPAENTFRKTRESLWWSGERLVEPLGVEDSLVVWKIEGEAFSPAVGRVGDRRGRYRALVVIFSSGEEDCSSPRTVPFGRGQSSALLATSNALPSCLDRSSSGGSCCSHW